VTPAESRVADAFDRLRACGPHDRERLLRADHTLTDVDRDQVRDLLAHDSPTDIFLGQPIQRVAGGLVEPLIDGPTPATIGRYRILRPIARGSFGSVFLARQSNPERDVAIKLLPPGADDAARRRFEFEAAALARLNHPNVTAVLELAYESGRPYIVMEYVDGVALDAFVAKHALSPSARIALLRQVCDGVAHIHQRGVLHRDLAPKNILVTGAGVPKIVDFGLACDAAAELRGDQRLTLPGSIIGTLRYISPEQLVGRAEDVDERSDTYALGVLAFELLLGDHPYLAAGASLADAVNQLQSAPLRLPHTKGASFGRELHAVLAKAVERNPAQRYSGPGALAEDLRRLVEQLPVTAVRAGTLYRARKLYARKRGVVWAMGIGLVLVSASIVNAAVSLRREVRNRDAALHALDAVVTRLLSPLGPRIGTLEERERLLAAIEADVIAMKPQTSRDPRVVKVYAGLRTAQSDIYRDRARNDLALIAIAEGVSAWETLYDLSEHDPAIGHEYSIAIVKHGDALDRSRRPHRAVSEYRRALAIDEALAARAPDDLRLLSNLFWSQVRVAAHSDKNLPQTAASYEAARSTADRMMAIAPDDWRSLDAHVRACIDRARAAGMGSAESVTALVSGEKAAARLIELDPASTVHHSVYLRILSRLLAARGPHTESIDLEPYVKRALEIERTLAANTGQTRYEDPDLIEFYNHLSSHSFEGGRFADAVAQIDKVLTYTARRMAGGNGIPSDAVLQASLLCGRRLAALRALEEPDAVKQTVAALDALQAELTRRFPASTERSDAASELVAYRATLLEQQATAAR